MTNAQSNLLPLYARYEPTIDSVALAHGVKGKRDVCLYEDERATKPKGLIPWHHKGKPTKSSKVCMLNCYKWRLIWLDDVK